MTEIVLRLPDRHPWALAPSARPIDPVRPAQEPGPRDRRGTGLPAPNKPATAAPLLVPVSAFLAQHIAQEALEPRPAAAEATLAVAHYRAGLYAPGPASAEAIFLAVTV